MTRWLALTLLMLVILTGMTSPVSASVRSYRDLSLDEKIALQASEKRLAQLDAALQSLEYKHQHRKISSSDYHWTHHDLVAFISEESNFQNGILIRPRGMSEDTRELLNNIAYYSVVVPAYLLAIAAKGIGSGSFSP